MIEKRFDGASFPSSWGRFLGGRAAPVRRLRGGALASRLLVVALCAALALPLAAVAPGPSGPAPGTVAVEAAAKKTKKKPKFKTVRETVTRTFGNATAIAIPTTGSPGLGSPYPSAIALSGLKNGVITDVNLTLHGFTHNGSPADVDVLLAPNHLPGLNAIVLSDAGGGGGSIPDREITLDDQAAGLAAAGSGIVTSGTFRPTNYGAAGEDAWPGAPAPTGNAALSVFNGANPNGSWRLFVADDTGGSSTSGGSIAGWSIQITAEIDKLVKVKKKKKP